MMPSAAVPEFFVPSDLHLFKVCQKLVEFCIDRLAAPLSSFLGYEHTCSHPQSNLQNVSH